MARKRKIEVIFSGDNRRLKRSIADTGQELNRFAGVSRRAAAGIKGAFAGIVVGVGVAAAVRATVTEIAGLEKTLSGVKAVTRATDGQMRDLTKTARSLGATTIFSAKEAAEGMEFLGRAGFETNAIIDAMPGLLDLAAAGALELGDAADIASNVLSGFGLQAKEINEVSDVLALTAASANTSVQQLGEAMSYVAPVAAAFGKTVEETSAAMGILSNAGIQASSAGTGLRGVMSKLASPAKAARDALASLGITVKDVNPQTKSLVEITNTFADAGLDAARAMEIFGERAGPAMLALVSQRGDLAELTQELKNADGAAERMAKTMADNLAGDAKALGSAVAELAQQLGDAGLTSVLRDATQGLTEFARELSGLMSGPSLEELQQRLNVINYGPAGGRSGKVTRAGRRNRIKQQIDDQLNELSGSGGLRNKLKVTEDEIVSARDRISNLVQQIGTIPEDRRTKTQGTGRSKRKTLFTKLNEELEQANTELEELTAQRQTLFNSLSDIELNFESLPPEKSGPVTDDNKPTGGKPRKPTKSNILRFPKQEEVKALKDPVDDFINSMSRYREELDLINPKLERFGELFAEGAFGDPSTVQAQNIYIEGIKRLGLETETVIDGIQEDTADLNEGWEDLGLTFASAFEDAIVQGGNLSDVMEGLEKDIIRIMTRKLVTEPLTNALSGMFSSGGGFGQLFGGLFGGGGAPVSSIPLKALGGSVGAGSPYIVGERGPELFVPSSNGNITPNNQLGGSTIVVNVNPPPGSSPDAYRLSARQGALEGSRMLGQSRGIS